MKASMVDLRRRMKDILKALDRNETVTITYRGRERAMLVPISQARRKAKRIRDHPFFGMWADDKEKEDVEAYVRKLRQDRYLDL